MSAFFTTIGDGAAMVVDELALRNIDVVKPSDETFGRMTETGVAAHHDRIIDLALAGRTSTYINALGIFHLGRIKTCNGKIAQ